jgi:hypothetical protein
VLPAALTAFVAAALVVPAAQAAPPKAGLLVPGKSLGGLKLGATQAQVRAAWGTGFGRCRGCSHPTWYFNYAPFSPKGAGVEFRRGRAAAIFTLWSPPGWRTPKGLRMGDEEARITALYGALTRSECGTYSALLLQQPAGVTAFYVAGGRLWGFGLLRPQVPECR